MKIDEQIEKNWFTIKPGGCSLNRRQPDQTPQREHVVLCNRDWLNILSTELNSLTYFSQSLFTRLLSATTELW